MDRRKQVNKLKKLGFSYRQIALKLKISKSTVQYYCNSRKLLNDQIKKRRHIKTMLVKANGGCCTVCKYSKSMSALDFHHKKPNNKQFSISNGIAKGYSWRILLNESKKCSLLCSNCHHELHDNETKLIAQ